MVIYYSRESFLQSSSDLFWDTGCDLSLLFLMGRAAAFISIKKSSATLEKCCLPAFQDDDGEKFNLRMCFVSDNDRHRDI
jgi:hypothetical protein